MGFKFSYLSCLAHTQIEISASPLTAALLLDDMTMARSIVYVEAMTHTVIDCSLSQYGGNDQLCPHESLCACWRH